MLPLLTRLGAQQPISRNCLGIHLGRHQLTTAYTEASTNGCCIKAVQQTPLAEPLFSVAPNSKTEAALTQALQQASKIAQQQWVSAQITLPDAAAVVHVFALDAIPKTDTEQQALAAWRMNRELHLPAGQYTFSCQALGQEGDQYLLLVTAIETSWLDCIRAALDHMGLLTTVIDIDAAYRFNRFHNTLVADQQHGGLIAIEPDYWSLQLWDSAGRLRFVRSRWLEQGADVDIESITLDTERHIRAYLANHEGVFGHLFVLATEQQAAALQDKLQQRMHSAPELLSPTSDLLLAKGISLNYDYPTSALTATLPR